MTKVRWDVSDSDAEEAVKVRSFDSPKPGMYVAVITECDVAGSGGDPDKPMLRVVYEIQDADKKGNKQFEGAQLWYYVLLPGHPSYDGFPMQKTDQFLQANGVATKRKRKGALETDEIVGVENVVQVRAGKNQDGDYRGEVANVLPYDEDEWEARKGDTTDDDADDDDEKYDDADIEVVDEDEDEDEADEAEADDEEDVAYDEMSIPELRDELKARDLNPKGQKASLIKRLEDDDESEETAAEPDEGEEDEDEENDYTSWSLSDLKGELEERDLSVKGTKATLIARLEDDDEGEEDDEEEEEEAPAPSKRKAAVKKPATRKKATAKKPAARKRGGGRGKSSDGFPFE